MSQNPMNLIQKKIHLPLNIPEPGSEESAGFQTLRFQVVDGFAALYVGRHVAPVPASCAPQSERYSSPPLKI